MDAPDEGYSIRYLYVFIDFPVFIPWTHQMKVIPGMCRAKLDI